MDHPSNTSVEALGASLRIDGEEEPSGLAIDIVVPVKPPIDAAVRVGSHHGFATDTPILVQETNNTVVWLRPHAVIAKVGTRSHSTEALTLRARHF